MFYILFSIFSNDSSFINLSNDALSTSVWCQPNEIDFKKCTFKNLCYNSKTNFIFILTNKSVISGLQNKHDFKKIKTSSVFNHNGMNMKLSIVSPNNTVLENIIFKKGPVFLMWRFKPDNILHTIHDDLLPLYVTYNELCNGDIQTCIKRYTLTFIDNHDNEMLSDWYRIFSKEEPIILSSVAKKRTICFETSHTGLSINSVVFQYGFKAKQGPIKANVNGQLFYQFSEFILKSLGIQKIALVQSKTIVLITRTLNRKILNEDFIISQLGLIHNRFENKTKLIARKIDFIQNSSREVLSVVASSKMMVGIHGSAMILALFLPIGGTALELFPFGISPEIVSPLYALSKVPGIYFNYFSWTNQNEDNTYPHPEYPPLLGGIYHLPKEKQIEIMNTKQVPAVECCHNPLYLYRMYQDTIVDSKIIPILEKILASEIRLHPQDNILYEDLHKTWYFPGAITNISCVSFQKYSLISWNHPINVDETKVQYKLVISVMDQSYLNFTTHNFIVVHRNNYDVVTIWIQCLIGDNESEIFFKECQ